MTSVNTPPAPPAEPLHVGQHVYHGDCFIHYVIRAFTFGDKAFISMEKTGPYHDCVPIDTLRPIPADRLIIDRLPQEDEEVQHDDT